MELINNYISIRQPFAEAIVRGLKIIENRSWSTSFRGRLFVHASKSTESLEDGLEFIREITGKPFKHKLTFGAIIGSVEITDCVISHPSPWFVGRFGFVLAQPRRVSPIYFSANTGIRPLPQNLLRQP